MLRQRGSVRELSPACSMAGAAWPLLLNPPHCPRGTKQRVKL